MSAGREIDGAVGDGEVAAGEVKGPLDRLEVCFDDEHAVANAGLVLSATPQQPAPSAGDLPRAAPHRREHHARLRGALIVVSRQLGHANPQITATVYAHLLSDSELDRAATVFEEAPNERPHDAPADAGDRTAPQTPATTAITPTARTHFQADGRRFESCRARGAGPARGADARPAPPSRRSADRSYGLYLKMYRPESRSLAATYSWPALWNTWTPQKLLPPTSMKWPTSWIFLPGVIVATRNPPE